VESIDCNICDTHKCSLLLLKEFAPAPALPPAPPLAPAPPIKQTLLYIEK